MKIVEQQVKLLTSPEAIKNMVLTCEYAARTCYNSTDRQTGNFEDAVKFLRGLLDKHHESVIEHSAISFELITNIGVSREFERHRFATIGFESDCCPSFSERSTRYCNYSKNSKYPEGIEFCFNKEDAITIREKYLEAPDIWPNVIYDDIKKSEVDYKHLINNCGMKAQFARHLLPLCTKTVFISTCNLREWRHIIKMRTSNAAHPDIRELIGMVYDEFVKLGLESLFKDVYAVN